MLSLPHTLIFQIVFLLAFLIIKWQDCNGFRILQLGYSRVPANLTTSVQFCAPFTGCRSGKGFNLRYFSLFSSAWVAVVQFIFWTSFSVPNTVASWDLVLRICLFPRGLAIDLGMAVFRHKQPRCGINFQPLSNHVTLREFSKECSSHTYFPINVTVRAPMSIS